MAVDGPDAARAAESGGARALVVAGAVDAVRAASELPILATGASLEAAARSGADACVVAAEDLEDDVGEELAESLARIDWVVRVDDDDELKRVLEEHDPEILLLDGDLEHALELLSDVPVGKLAIARADSVTSAEIAELERRGVDAVIVSSHAVAALGGRASSPA